MEKHYNTLSDYYKRKFGQKIIKLSLDANFSCPNKDGKKGIGGCIFCTHTPYIGNSKDDLVTQVKKMKDLVKEKSRNAKYIIYLEAGSNTYASVDKLKSIYEGLIKLDDVVGINIGTRCDCLNDDVMAYLIDLSKRTYLTVELGLQSCHNSTLNALNRNHTKEEFSKAVRSLKKAKIDVVVHIINGLPNETEKMMIETAKYVNSLGINGIKIHMLYVEKDSKFYDLYNNNSFHLLTKEEYISILAKQLQVLNKDIVIHRIISNPDIKKLYKPEWLIGKFSLLNDIDKYLCENNIYQGDLTIQ